jgi:hypothetical protein
MARMYDQANDVLEFSFEYNNDETTSLNKLANGNSQIDLELLRRIALWKFDRVLDVPNDTLEKLRAVATDRDLCVDSKETQLLIEELIGCRGVGLPMASTILKFLRPDVFPIIDVRAYRALYGTKPYFSQSTNRKNIQRYLAYTAEVQSISRRLGPPLRDIDEQLYEFDKKFNGAI